MTSIIPALADPSNAYNDQHVYVLSSLAEVKSIVLITDIDSPDSLILPLFSSSFDVVSGSTKSATGEELAKNVEYDMTRLLVPIIDEASVLAPDVIDVIMAQFLRVDPRVIDQPISGKNKKHGPTVDTKQDTLLLKEYPPAYNMAKAICTACPEKMTSYVSQYFNNVIIDASGTSGANGLSKHSGHRRVNLDDSDDEGENIKELSKAHRLIREIWRACPDVLQNVIPQLEAEFSAESVSLRLLATQTIGDVAAGIGVAGPPPPESMDPAAYPPAKLTNRFELSPQPNVLLTPLSPKPFPQVHSSAYESFLTRKQDKSASVRAAWVTGVGRILLTSAGGVGLSSREEQTLADGLKRMLGDADEKVRIAAVEVIGTFGFSDVVKKLGAYGGISTPGSILAVLTDRAKDRKHPVREQAMKVLGRIWGVAAGEIEENNEQVVSILKEVPSRLLETFYTNNLEIQALLDHITFELLLPLNYPPIKSKSSKSGSSQSKKQKDSGEGDSEIDADAIRARRILTLARGLSERAEKVFFAFPARQTSMKTFMDYYLSACEDYNGGVMDQDEQAIKTKLNRVVDHLSKLLPDPSRVSTDLMRFAKMHDRRSYQLIRFSMAAVSDYRTVTKAIRELSKRIQGNTSAPASLLESLTPLLYRSSSLILNRSHIPTIMDLARSDQSGLGYTAHEMLKETSTQIPEVLEAHVQDMCKDLETHAPDAKRQDDPRLEETLKACSGFAKKLPNKLPTDRKFFIALSNYALYSSSPKAAKHAVSILLATSDKKQMQASELIKKSISDFEYGSEHFLTRLATISQLNLLAPHEADESNDIVPIATNEILLKNRNPKPASGYSWSEDPDVETTAKEWALKILVNRVRGQDRTDDDSEFRSLTEPVYKILNTLISNDGELSKKQDSPPDQKSRLRLLAAKLILKLCYFQPQCERLLTPTHFNSVALVAQDPLLPVRSGFVAQLKKRLASPTSHLSPRWYAVAFILAFEPNANLKDSTLTWLRSRSHHFSQQKKISERGTDQQLVMEPLFARLLSLLAHHPDYPDDSVDESTKVDHLVDFARYILFYLTAVANENNLSLIFHIAQRAKQVQDAISHSDKLSTHLHTLSDLSQATIRLFADIYSQQHKIGGASGNGAASILQTYPGKMRLPSSLFANISSHDEAQRIAEKNFLPEEVDDKLERIVRSFMKPKSHQSSIKKRKLEVESGEKNDTSNNGTGAVKKSSNEKNSLPIRKSSSGTTPSSKKTKRRKMDEDEWEGQDARRNHDGDDAAPSASRRRSGRGSKKVEVSYAEVDSSDDDKQMEQDNSEDDEKNGSESEGEEENSEQDEEEEEESNVGVDDSKKRRKKDSSPQGDDEKEAAPESDHGDEDGDDIMKDTEQSSPAPEPTKRSSRSKKFAPKQTKKQTGRQTSSPVAAKGKRSQNPKPTTPTSTTTRRSTRRAP